MGQHYEAMTKEFTQRLFGDFLNRSYNVMLIFLDFPDLDFLQHTTAFYDERGFYPANTFFKEFNNFQGRKARGTAGEEMGFDLPNPIIIEEHFILAFTSGIMYYIWQQ